MYYAVIPKKNTKAKVTTHIHAKQGPTGRTGEKKRDKVYRKTKEKVVAAVKILQTGKLLVDGLNRFSKLKRREILK